MRKKGEALTHVPPSAGTFHGEGTVCGDPSLCHLPVVGRPEPLPAG